MKREELTALGLTAEQVDSVMGMNGQDIEKHKAGLEREKARAQAIEEQLSAAREGLKAFEGVDLEELRGQIGKLQGELAAKDTEYRDRIGDMEFHSRLRAPVATAKGRSCRAILGELGEEQLEELKSSKNQEADIQSALERLRQESGYLFEGEQVPPPYAAGTGTTPFQAGKYTPEMAAIRAAAGLKNH